MSALNNTPDGNILSELGVAWHRYEWANPQSNARYNLGCLMALRGKINGYMHLPGAILRIIDNFAGLSIMAAPYYVSKSNRHYYMWNATTGRRWRTDELRNPMLYPFTKSDGGEIEYADCHVYNPNPALNAMESRAYAAVRLIPGAVLES